MTEKSALQDPALKDPKRQGPKPEYPQQPIEPEMQKTPEEDHGRGPASEPPKEKRVDEL